MCACVDRFTPPHFFKAHFNAFPIRICICHTVSMSLFLSRSRIVALRHKKHTLSNELIDQISLRMLHAYIHTLTHRFYYISFMIMYDIHSLCLCVCVCVLQIELTILLPPLFQQLNRMHFNVYVFYVFCIVHNVWLLFVCHWHNSILK